MNEALKRIPSLDGLRAISVALVVFSHLIGELPNRLENAVGNLGVRFFFVISGFLITSILVAEFEKTSTVNLSKFYFRRTLRIFPAYYFFLAVVLILSLAGVFQISFESFLSSVTYTSNYIEPAAWELGHSWSLSIEEQFYLIFPGLLLICGLTKMKRVLIFVILATPLIRVINFILLSDDGGSEIPLWYIFGFHTNMDALAIGCLLAVYREKLHENKFYQNFLGSSAAFFLLPLIIAAVVYNYSYTSLYFGLGITVLHFSIVLLIDWVVVNHKGAAGRFLNFGPLRFIGALSYSIYLWQQLFTKYAEDKWWTHFPANIILLTALSLFSYFLIEKKFLAIRQVLEKKLFTKKPENLIIQTEVV